MYKDFAKKMRTIKRPLNYILIVVFLICVCIFPTHMTIVAGALMSLPNWMGLLIASILGGSHLIRSYKRDVMDSD